MRISSLILLLIISIQTPLFATVRVVGRGQQITSLRAAIQLSNAGDTIRLLSGVYKEGSLLVNKRLTLIGENFPVLDGENKYETLLISASRVSITGIRFDRSGYSAMNDYAAIKVVDTDGVVLNNNRITNAYFAIHISNSTNIQIHHNQIAGTPGSEQMTGNGIHLWKCSGAHIYDNQVSGHRDGIYFEFVTDSRIERNYSSKNIRYGLHFMFSNTDHYTGNVFLENGAGVAVMYSKNVTMLNNRFEHNWGASAYGLLLKDITDSKIEHNSFLQNTVGIHMEGSSRLMINRNLFQFTFA